MGTLWLRRVAVSSIHGNTSNNEDYKRISPGDDSRVHEETGRKEEGKKKWKNFSNGVRQKAGTTDISRVWPR